MKTAIRNIPEEWTPEMWQTHVCAMEKRMNEFERELHNLKQAQPMMSAHVIGGHKPNPQSWTGTNHRQYETETTSGIAGASCLV